MPIYLKSLELQGYKTFASRTLFEFSGKITAIVGPNGSGKSNIADALRWVLGEQSYGLLRARKTEDMIFSGSQQRPRAGMAAATILFDNTHNWLPIEFSEVAIARRAYRDGKNEYLLNGQHIRLRDIRELLAQAGLSQRTYTILGQGMVDASLALKPEDRRTLFEEAAGIGLYRSRREEALRRLETTHRNLDRVLDIMAELKPRLRYLERQARKASEHATLQADLRILLRDWYGYHWHRTQREMLETRATLQTQEANLQQARQKLHHTQHALAALDDHLRELRNALSQWRAARSRIYRQKEEALRQLAVLEERQRAHQRRLEDLQAQIQRLDDDIQSAQARLDSAQKELQRLQKERDEAQTAWQKAQDALTDRQTQRDESEKQTAQLRRQLENLIRQQAEKQAYLQSQSARLQSLDALHQQAETQAQRAEKAFAQADARLQEKKSALESAQSARQAAQKTLESAQQAVKHNEARRQALQEALSSLQAEMSRLQAEQNVLTQAEENLSGYAAGARRLLSAIRKSELNGSPKALSALLNVPAELEQAIAAALGEFTDAILLADSAESDKALDMLAAEQSGRAALLPLAALKDSARSAYPAEDDLLGIAADLVSCPQNLRPAVDLLLGNTLIVRDRAAARRLLASLPAETRVITLRGEVFSPQGPVIAGKSAGSGALSRARRQRELNQQIERLTQTLAQKEAALQKAREELNRAFQSLSTAENLLQKAQKRQQTAQNDWQQAEFTRRNAEKDLQRRQAEIRRLNDEQKALHETSQKMQADLSALNEAIAQISQNLRQSELALLALPLDALQRDVTYWEKRLAVINNTLSDLKNRRSEQEKALKHLQARQKQILQQKERLQQEQRAQNADIARLKQENERIQAELQAIQDKIHPAEEDERRAEEKRRALQNDLSEAQRLRNAAERTFNQIQLELTRKEDALNTLRGRIEEDFGLVMLNYEPDISGPVPLPLGNLVEDLPQLKTLPPGLEKEMKEKRAILRRMGAVNMEARQEYEKESQRYAFMEAQVEDLRQAEDDLRAIIAEMDDLTRKAFMSTYEAVAKRFSEIFQRLFGGGSARLILTDPDNLTETGVDIEARLPGRRSQELSLLSGGERSLTAIALVFALLKVSPTPLCVMDEVDAMLDEANVARFRDLLLELSRETQFIIITHNRNTVQAADVIYGITMGHDSTSQMVSLRLDEISDEMLRSA